MFGKSIRKEIYRNADGGVGAGAGAFDANSYEFLDPEGGRLPGDEDPEAVVGEGEPAGAAPVVPSAATLDDDALMAEFEKRSHLASRFKQTPPPARSEPEAPREDKRVQQVAELQERAAAAMDVTSDNYSPAEAFKMQKEADRLERTMLLDQMRAENQAFANAVLGQVSPVTYERTVTSLGLDDTERQELSPLRKEFEEANIDFTAAIQHPLLGRLIANDARARASERAPSGKPPTHISAGSEPQQLSSEDWRAIREFEKMTGDRVSSDVVREAKKGF